jgi:type IV secretion system protein VirD4
MPLPSVYQASPVGYRTLGADTPEAINLGRYTHPADGITSKLRYDGERNLVVFGPNGSGKGTRLCLTNALGMEGKRSLVFADPKGEIAAVSAPFRRTLGRVIILNPFNVLTKIPGYEDLESCGFNPLLALDPRGDSFNSDAADIAAAVCPINGKDPYWDMAARSLVAAIIMFVVLEAHGLCEPFAVDGMLPLVNGKPTIARVRALLCQPSAEGRPPSREPIGLPALALKMAESLTMGLRNKAGQFIDWTKDVQSVARTAMQHTECFDDTLMAADLAKGTFDFRDLKREPITVYLIVPPKQMERHAKWLRLVVTTALMVNLEPRRSDDCRILFMLDEFFALGHLEIISTVWALVRGYGIQIMPILQDLGQLKKLYPDMWETFIGMAAAVTSFAPNDQTTAEWLSKRCGDTTRKIRTVSASWTDSGGENSGFNDGTSSGSGGSGGTSGRSSGTSSGRNKGWSANESKSSAPGKVPLITPHQLTGLKPGYMLLALAGVANVVSAYAPAYWQVEKFALRARSNPYVPGS